MSSSPPRSHNVRGTAVRRPSALGHRICILGGGFGGLYCALTLDQQLKKLALTAEITLVEPREHFLFTPLLYEPLTHELAPWEVAPTYTELLKRSPIRLIADRVKAIDLAAGCCWLEDGEALSYDYLVVALGSQQRPPTVRGGPNHTLTFTSLEDLLRLDRQLVDLEASDKSALQVVVIGAGPSGVELACKLADRLGARGEVVLLDRRTVILRSYPEAIRRAALAALGSRNVKVFTSVLLNSINANSLSFSWQGMPQIQTADLILWTVGTVPRPWPGDSALNLAERYQYEVRPTLQLPEAENVFLLGDMAAMPSTGATVAPMTAQSAFQAGPVVARNIIALMTGRPLRPFCYSHLGDMLTLGRGEAVVYGFGLCLTGRLGGISRLWAYWLRLPTWGHRWRVLKARIGRRSKHRY